MADDILTMTLTKKDTGRLNVFSKAFAQRNNQFEEAIQSLDSLNDQIVQFIFTPSDAQQSQALHSSVALMRRLLVDAQAKFRKMMSDNAALASRIDGDIQSAQQEVSLLRAELADTNKRITEITNTVVVVSPPECMEALTLEAPIASANSKCQKCKHQSIDEEDDLVAPLQAKIGLLESQNDRLSQHNNSLQRELEHLRLSSHQQTRRLSEEPQLDHLETELRHAKDALTALKQDRKRLKAEKFDLLNQMKQLYGTLEDKEKELRDFIRNYEQRMKESDENLKQLVREREDSEREKWSILKHARDEAERSVALCAQLGLKDAQVKQLQEELTVLREKMGYMSDVDSRSMRTNGYRSPSAASTPTPTLGSDPNSSYAGTPTITVDSDTSPNHVAAQEGHRPSLPGLSRSAEEIYNSSGSSDAGVKKVRRKRDAKGTWGSLSRVFHRSRHRKTLEPGAYHEQRSSWSPQSSICASPLTEESYGEKLKLLEEAQGLPMERWRANMVLAWLEVTLGMPQYGATCAENIKSGKILLELSDQELETGLGVNNVMHRRKLRLAIEEHRDPSLCTYPKICLLTHVWVLEEWLPSLGLACYSEHFGSQLVDGRVLESLIKKDLEKYLGVTRKFHQVSIMHAIQLLRMVKFDRQVLAQRRSHSDNMDVDPLVWSNQRFTKWARSIDLSEYAENLRDSGVHGALVVLEPSFTADAMATALGIPASKNIIRRHLTTELENLIQPARMSLEAEALVTSKRSEKKALGSLPSYSTGSLGRNFLRSSSSRASLVRSDKGRSSVRLGSSSQESPTQTLGVEVDRRRDVSIRYSRSGTSPTECFGSYVEMLTVTPV